MAFLILLVVAIVCGLIGMSMAQSKGREPFLWALLCFFFGPIGIVILAVAADQSPVRSYSRDYAPVYSPSPRERDDDYEQPKVAAPVVVEKFDKKKWQVLKGVDPDIAAASAEVSAMSVELDDVLAERYLVLNDKTYLSALVSTIVKENAERIEAERTAKEQAQAAMSEKQKAQMETRIARSKATIEDIKNNGMFNTRNRKRVVSAEMYFGSEVYNHGYAKIVYEDGTAELRSGDSWGACASDLA